MIETIERVIHPGWLTILLEDEKSSKYQCYHMCVSCGFTIDGKVGGKHALLEHTSKKHHGEAFSLEIYIFRSDIHALHVYYGLEAFEWRN
jgi:hypothetical protein